MKFENNPQLILTKDEFETLDKALKLCRDMDSVTDSCTSCPIYDSCKRTSEECVYISAHKALKRIIDTAIVK